MMILTYKHSDVLEPSILRIQHDQPGIMNALGLPWKENFYFSLKTKHQVGRQQVEKI